MKHSADYHKERIKIFDRLFTIGVGILVALSTWLGSNLVKEQYFLKEETKNVFLVIFVFDFIVGIVTFIILLKMLNESEKLK